MRLCLEPQDPDMYKLLLGELLDSLMSAQASATCNASYGEVPNERVKRSQWLTRSRLRYESGFDYLKIFQITRCKQDRSTHIRLSLVLLVSSTTSFRNCKYTCSCEF